MSDAKALAEKVLAAPGDRPFTLASETETLARAVLELSEQCERLREAIGEKERLELEACQELDEANAEIHALKVAAACRWTS